MKKMIRSGLMILLLIFTTSIFFGCGGGDGDGDDFGWDYPGDNEKVTITFLHMWPEHVKVFNEIARNFMIEHENVTVQLSNTTHEYINKSIQTAYLGGEMPDVFTYFAHAMGSFAVGNDGRVAAKLTDAFPDMKDVFLNDGEAWNVSLINGDYYSVPFRATCIMIFYNKTLFAQKGWTVPNTFEEFEALVKRISSESDYIPLAASGKDNSSINFLMDAMNLYDNILNGATEEDGFYSGRLQPDYTDMENSVLKYNKIKNWYAAEYFGKNARGVDDTTVMSYLMNKQAAMAYANNNQISTIISGMDGDEIGAFAVPKPAIIEEDIGYVYGGYDGLSISRTSQNKYWALEFIKYLVSDEVQDIFANQEKSIVVNKNVTYDDPQMAAFAEIAKNVGKYKYTADYVLGTNSENNGTLKMNYITGNSTYTAEALIKLMDSNIYKDMQDPLLNNPTVDWIPWKTARKSYDNSWLR